MANGKVVIVGGGCAGIAAAYELQKKGVDYVLLEAGNRLGGRVGTRHEGKFEYAIGAAFTEPQWAQTFEYLDEFGMMPDVNTVQRQIYGFWYNGQVNYLPMGGDSNPMDILKFRGLPAKTVPQLLRFVAKFAPYMKYAGADHDFSGLAEISNMSTAEFGLKYGGEEVVDRILTPFLGTMVLTRAQEVSVAHPIALMSLMQGMCCVKGGLGAINDKLIERIEGHYQLNTPVKRIVIENGAVKGVEAEGGFIEADQVIMAVDAEVALQIAPDLPEAMRKPLTTCKYSATYNYIFGIDEAVVPEDFLSVFIPGSENSILTTIFDENAILKNNPQGTGVMHAFTAGWHDKDLMWLSPEERERLVIREVQKFLPAFPDKPSMVKCLRYDKAVNLEAPGQYVAIQDLLNNHAHDVKGLHLAGEYLFLIACTEGAWSTGAAAGRETIAEL